MTPVTLESAGPVAEIGLRNGPLNLVDKAMLRSLDAIVGEVEHSSDIRCVIVHGGDARAFCAGSNVREFAIAPGPDPQRDVVAQMGFAPAVSADLKAMDPRIFEALMGLSADIHAKPRRHRSPRMAAWLETHKKRRG